MLLKQCLCGSSNSSSGESKGGVEYIVCAECGIGRQVLDMDVLEHQEYYRSRYHSGVYVHTYDHDLEVARSRVSDYNLVSCRNLLDVGCGNGAFLTAAKERSKIKGMNCVGVDPGKSQFTPEGLDIYHDDFQDVGFPTGLFEVVTCHDVVEHVIDPVGFLKEIFRVTARGGIAYVEIPDYSHKHHWKAVEHLWMFDEDQFSNLLEQAGFRVERISKPVDTKWLFRCKKPAQYNMSVLIPNGIGDAVWCLTKLQGFLKSVGQESCDLYVASPPERPDRTLPLLTKIPFINAEGYCRIRLDNPIWKRMYFDDGPTVFENAFGCDYFMGYNGILRHGRSLEEVDPEYGCDWDFRLFESSFEKRATERFLSKFGAYIAVHIIASGAYQKWIREFPVTEVNKALRYLSDAGYTIVLYGAGYDRITSKVMDAILHGVPGKNLIGKTNLDQMFALLRGACAVYGFPTGPTMIPAIWGKPTVLLWQKHFVEKMWWNSVPSRSWEKNYKALPTESTTGTQSAKSLLEMIK